MLLVRPCGAVDALQLLVLGIATPVGAGQLGQLEGFQEARVRHVRTAAHVDVFFVIVKAHGLFVRHVLDQAQLVVFATGLEHFDHFGARSDFLDHVVIFFDQLLHALFDGGQVVRSERTFEGDVVIETFVDDRADDHLGGRVQLLDRVANQVGARVANDLQPSSSFGVMICSDASLSMMSLASTSLPLTLPATVALARPAPMDAATSATETG